MASYTIEVGGYPNSRVKVNGRSVRVEVEDQNGWRDTTAPNVIDRALCECVSMLAHQKEALELRLRRKGR